MVVVVARVVAVAVDVVFTVVAFVDGVAADDAAVGVAACC